MKIAKYVLVLGLLALMITVSTMAANVNVCSECTPDILPKAETNCPEACIFVFDKDYWEDETSFKNMTLEEMQTNFPLIAAHGLLQDEYSTLVIESYLDLLYDELKNEFPDLSHEELLALLDNLILDLHSDMLYEMLWDMEDALQTSDMLYEVAWDMEDGYGAMKAFQTAPSSVDFLVPSPANYAPSGGISTFNTEEYSVINDRGFVSPLLEPLSTFASSVDTASYSLARAKLSKGETVSPDMVQVEEFVNYFKYDYPEPTDSAPLAINAELGPCPWEDEHLLLQIGIQAEEIDMSDAPPANLVFLIDVSGSMDSADKLGLVRQSFMLLTQNLRDTDRVSIVTYAGSEATLLDGVTGEDKALIMSVIESLEAGGVTYGSGGIEAAYDCAERNFIIGGINRVILATDGDFNVGITSEGDLSRLISEKRETGVFLSVLGYGMGNYKDNKMETLAKDGHGNAYYIDSLLEAQRVLIEEMGATLNTIAKDVKLQVEFNPNGVKAYRLLGYENRMLHAEDFDDDSVNAGAIGSGHSVTALYEIIPAGSDEEVPGIDLKYQERITTPSDELLNIAVRYKLPDGDESSRIDLPVTLAELQATPSDNMLWASAVAEFALSLRQSALAPGANIPGSLKLAKSADYHFDPYRVELVEILESLARDTSL